MPSEPYMGKDENSVHSPRLGFFGGTFDPPHNGHLKIAHTAIEKANLTKLFFCPAHHAPLRTEPALFSAHHRLGMVEAICKNHPVMEVYDAEIKHRCTRYSYETIAELKSQFPDHKLFFVLGADQFARLSEWKGTEQLAQLVHFLVFEREKDHTDTPPVKNLTMSLMKNPLINISSTEIRSLLHRDKLPDSQLPAEVVSYMLEQNLFPLNLSSPL